MWLVGTFRGPSPWRGFVKRVASQEKTSMGVFHWHQTMVHWGPVSKAQGLSSLSRVQKHGVIILVRLEW